MMKSLWLFMLLIASLNNLLGQEWEFYDDKPERSSVYQHVVEHRDNLVFQGYEYDRSADEYTNVVQVISMEGELQAEYLLGRGYVFYTSFLNYGDDHFVFVSSFDSIIDVSVLNDTMVTVSNFTIHNGLAFEISEALVNEDRLYLAGARNPSGLNFYAAVKCLSLSGEELWEYRVDSVDIFSGVKDIVAYNDGFLIGGFRYGTREGFVHFINKEGEGIWKYEREITSPNVREIVNHISFDNDGNILLGGGGSTSWNLGYVAKLDSDGNEIWNKSLKYDDGQTDVGGVQFVDQVTDGTLIVGVYSFEEFDNDSRFHVKVAEFDEQGEYLCHRDYPADSPDNSYAWNWLLLEDESLVAAGEITPYKRIGMRFQTAAQCKVVLNDAQKPRDGITLFPNPADEEIHILGAEPFAACTFQILNLNGAVVRKGICDGRSLFVDKLRPGMYMVEIQTGQESFVRKFIKQ